MSIVTLRNEALKIKHRFKEALEPPRGVVMIINVEDSNVEESLVKYKRYVENKDNFVRLVVYDLTADGGWSAGKAKIDLAHKVETPKENDDA